MLIDHIQMYNLALTSRNSIEIKILSFIADLIWSGRQQHKRQLQNQTTNNCGILQLKYLKTQTA